MERELVEAQQRQRREREAYEERERLRKEREEREEKERERRAVQERRRKEREEREERERKKMEDLQRQAAAEREREAKATLQMVVSGSNLVTFAPGLEIKYLITGFDLCKITIRKLPKTATPTEISNIFREQGMADAMFQPLSEPKIEGEFKVAEYLVRKEEAQVLSVGLKGLEFRENILEFDLGSNTSWGSMTTSWGQGDDASRTLTLLWSRPSARIIATYHTLEEAQRRARELDGQSLHGRKLSATMNSRPDGPAARFWVESSIRIGNLSPTTTTADVQVLSEAHTVRAVKSNLYDFDVFLERLKAILNQRGCVEGSFQTVDMDSTRVKAVAVFPNHAALEAVEAALKGAVMGPRITVIVPPEHRYSITIPVPQYRAQKGQWDEMTEAATGGKAFVRVREQKKGLAVFINVEGSDPKAVGQLKVRVEGLVAGERLGSEYWHTTYLWKGKDICDSVLSCTGVYVSVDRRVHALKVYGKGEGLDRAKRMIGEDIARLKGMEVELSVPRASFKFLLRTGLQILKDSYGEENVTLSVGERGFAGLKVRGGDDALHQARKLIKDAAAAAHLGLDLAQETPSGTVCPICYDTPSPPAVLLVCGHSYCDPCLHHYLTNAATSDNFPLVCMGDEAKCKSPLPISLIKRFLPEPHFTHLVNAVFSSYIQRNPSRYKYCTTPDCEQIYQCDPIQKFHQCPSCFSRICSGCNAEAHDGMTCEERRIQSDPAEQDRLNIEWAQVNNVKRCPSCALFVEKRDGCNHMTCPCGAHFCWICLGAFSSSEIYPHMDAAHGGNGL